MSTQTTGTDLERTKNRFDDYSRQTTGASVYHCLAIGSIAGSVALLIAGKKNLAIFIELSPPTFEALRHRS
jgi:hypothetical protein